VVFKTLGTIINTRKLELMAKRAREVSRYSIQYHHDARKISDPLQYILKQFIILKGQNTGQFIHPNHQIEQVFSKRTC